MISIVIEDMQRVRKDCIQREIWKYLDDLDIVFLLDAWIETLIEFQKVV